MSSSKEYLVEILLVVVFILSYGTLVAGSEYRSGSGTIDMLYQSEPLDGAKALQLQQQNGDSENPLDFTLWGSRENQSVSNQEFFRQTTANLIYLCGSSRLLFGTDTVLEAADTKGCLISRDIADKLYGSQKVKGNILTYNSQEYTIRGVINDLSETVVLPADKKTTAVLDAVALGVGAKPEHEVWQDYQNRYGEAAKKIVLSTFSDGAKTAAGAPYWLIGLVLFIPALLTAVRLRREPVKWLVWTAAAAVLAVIFWQLGKAYLAVDITASPTRWSDFAYWRDYCAEKAASIKDLLMLEKRAPEQIYVNNWIKTMISMILSVAALALGIRKWRRGNLGRVYCYGILSIVISFVVICLTGSRTLAENYSWQLLLPYYFGSSFILTKLQDITTGTIKK